MGAALNSIRAGLEGSAPEPACVVVVASAGTLRAGKAGKDRACVRARPAFPTASFGTAQIALDSHLSDPFGSFPHKQRGVIRGHVTLGSLKILQGGLLGWGCCYEREIRMLRHEMNQKTPPGFVAVDRADVVAACLAVLIRELHGLGLKREVALAVLRDAADRIDAALTRGPRALVLYRLDRKAPVGIVSDDDARLATFAAEAEASGAGLIGVNPYRVAVLAAKAKAEGCATVKQGGQYDRALH